MQFYTVYILKVDMNKIYHLAAIFCTVASLSIVSQARIISKRSYSDQSVRAYLTERVCWSNEVCKEEFQTLFRCKCPMWSHCRSPGRYYNAICSISETGYIWTQPQSDWTGP